MLTLCRQSSQGRLKRRFVFCDPPQLLIFSALLNVKYKKCSFGVAHCTDGSAGPEEASRQRCSLPASAVHIKRTIIVTWNHHVLNFTARTINGWMWKDMSSSPFLLQVSNRGRG